MTILSIAQQASIALNIEPPETLFAAYNEGDVSDQRLLLSLKQTVAFLAADYDWSALKAVHMFQSVAGEEQVLPPDFLRLIPETFWDASLNRSVDGPLDDDAYAQEKASLVTRITPCFSVFGDALHFIPDAAAGVNYSFMYIRKAIAKNDQAVRILDFTSDSDAPLWDDELMCLGVRYHYLKMEKFDYAQDELDFYRCMQNRLKRDGGNYKINMAGTPRSAGDMVNAMKNNAAIIK